MTSCEALWGAEYFAVRAWGGGRRTGCLRMGPSSAPRLNVRSPPRTTQVGSGQSAAWAPSCLPDSHRLSQHNTSLINFLISSWTTACVRSRSSVGFVPLMKQRTTEQNHSHTQARLTHSSTGRRQTKSFRLRRPGRAKQPWATK